MNGSRIPRNMTTYIFPRKCVRAVAIAEKNSADSASGTDHGADDQLGVSLIQSVVERSSR